MAARSSSESGSVKTLRITYQELLEFAESLETEKKKKSSKRRSKENAEERAQKRCISPSKSANTESQLSNHVEKEAKKPEKSNKEERRSSKKKDGERKKHRERPHNDEKPSESAEETESRSKRDKSTKTCKENDKKKSGSKKKAESKKTVCIKEETEKHENTLGTPASRNEGENSCSHEERGIIRIPKGVDIHKEDSRIADSEENLSENTEVSENKPAVVEMHDQLKEKTHKVHFSEHDNKVIEEISPKVSVEKRLKAVNRQRAQQLLKKSNQAETSLSNLLSKGISDRGSLRKVCILSKEIQDLYQGVLMLDLSLANENDVDQLLWKNAFYQVIETFRKYSKLFLGYSKEKNVMSHEEITNELHQFLEGSSVFYSSLLEGLQNMYQFDVQEIVSQPRKTEFMGRNAKLALLSCHHTLIFLGDIQRYKEQLQPSKGINWSSVRNWYLKASKLAPKNGKPYNQLAVIAVYANRKLDAIYYYIRSLSVSSPILTAREKLTTIFHEIQKRAEKIQWEEEMQRRQNEQRSPANDQGHARNQGKARSIFSAAAREVGLVAKKDSSHGRHEVWMFIRQGMCRRLILTEHGKVQPVDAAGHPITKDQQENHEKHREPKVESPKISLQEVNKKFMLHFLCAHGLLYTRIGMEKLPALTIQLMGELHTLLGFPQCSSVSCITLLQMSAINMFAIENTAPRENPETFVRLGTPQDQALNLAIDMLISVLNSCCEILAHGQEDCSSTSADHHGNSVGFGATLRQYLPSVKVWFDWMTSYHDLWQASNIGIHRILWESVAQFTNSLLKFELPELVEDGNDDVLVTLTEDDLLAGFKPLCEAKKYSMTITNLENKELAQDLLHVIAVEEFAKLLTSLSNPTLQYSEGTEQYTAVIIGIPTSPDVKSSSVAVHMDVDHTHNQESYESDDVIIESVLEDIDSGDEADKGFKELKAKKDQLAKELEDHEEKHSKVRAVIQENVSRPLLMLENHPSYLVPDTNCFIDQLSGLQAIVMSGDFTLIVPLVVINELDGLKKDLMVDKYRDYTHAQMVIENARAAVDFLEDQFSRRSPDVRALTSKGTVMDTIAFRSEDSSARKGNNDDVILSCCLHYCEENYVNRLATADKPITIRRKVVLLTDDRNLRVKAYTRNVPVLTVPQFRQMARL